MAPTQVRAQQTQARILDGALSVAAEGALTVKALSARSGVSVGSIYHHFGTLDGVRAAVYQRAMSSLLDHLIEALGGARTPEEGVKVVVVGYLTWSVAHGAQARFIHTALAEPFQPPGAEAIAASKAPRVGALLEGMAPWIRSGEIVPLTPHLYEMIIIGPPAEVVRRWLGGLPLSTVEDAARLLPARIWAALRAPGA